MRTLVCLLNSPHTRVTEVKQTWEGVVPLKLDDSCLVNESARLRRIYRIRETVLNLLMRLLAHRTGPTPMTFNFMIGAIIGSSLAIALGGPPMRRLMAVIQERVKDRGRD